MTATPAARAARVARGRANPELIPHGTLSGYQTWKCRCWPCRDAQMEQQRQYRKRRREAISEAKDCLICDLLPC